MALILPDLVMPSIEQIFPTTKRWHIVKPCGTSAAYRRHHRRGEPLDRACRQAEARRQEDYRARVRKTGGKLGGRWPSK